MTNERDKAIKHIQQHVNFAAKPAKAKKVEPPMDRAAFYKHLTRYAQESGDPIKDVAEAARWYLARQNARSLSDMTEREAAELFRDGVKPIQDSDVDDYLNNYHEDYEGNGNEAIHADLDDHFGRR